jgi:alcohol dehydrogenase
MKAAVFREHSKDPRQVVKIEDIDVPKIKHNEVLIKVEAAAEECLGRYSTRMNCYQGV